MASGGYSAYSAPPTTHIPLLEGTPFQVGEKVEFDWSPSHQTFFSTWISKVYEDGCVELHCAIGQKIDPKSGMVLRPIERQVGFRVGEEVKFHDGSTVNVTTVSAVNPDGSLEVRCSPGCSVPSYALQKIGGPKDAAQVSAAMQQAVKAFKAVMKPDGSDSDGTMQFNAVQMGVSTRESMVGETSLVPSAFLKSSKFQAAKQGHGKPKQASPLKTLACLANFAEELAVPLFDSPEKPASERAEEYLRNNSSTDQTKKSLEVLDAIFQDFRLVGEKAAGQFKLCKPKGGCRYYTSESSLSVVKGWVLNSSDSAPVVASAIQEQKVYKCINKVLADDDLPRLKALMPYIQSLDHYLNMQSPSTPLLHPGGIVYSGVAVSETTKAELLHEGNMIRIPRYLSTSAEREVASDESHCRDLIPGVVTKLLLVIEIPKNFWGARDISEISDFPFEKETVFPAYAQYLVKKVSLHKDPPEVELKVVDKYAEFDGAETADPGNQSPTGSPFEKRKMIVALFKEHDKDGSGCLEWENGEIKSFIKSCFDAFQRTVPPEQHMAKLWSLFDEDESNSMDQQECVDMITLLLEQEDVWDQDDVLLQLFAEHDKDGSQELEWHNGEFHHFLKACFDTIGCTPADETHTHQLFASFDADMNGCLGKEECLQMVRFLLDDARTASQEQSAAQELFSEHDKDGSGQLEWNAGEIRAFVKACCDKLGRKEPSEMEMYNLYNMFDTDKSLSLDKLECLDMLNHLMQGAGC